MTFTVVSYGLSVYPPGATFGPRTHTDYELVWIVNGEVTWECDGERHDAPPGSLILGRPGMRESYQWDPQRQTRHAFIHFLIEGDRGSTPPEDQWPLIRHLPEGDIVRPLFRHLIWLLDENRNEWWPLVLGGLQQLVLSFVHGAVYGRSEGRLELPEPVEKSLQYVQRRWARDGMENPQLSELARAAGVSEVHLCRLFRDALGHGPIGTLRMLRLDRAAMLLARSNLQIQEIARLTGFESPFHFTRCFKHLYGVPPREYRGQVDRDETVLPRELLLLRRVADQISPEQV